MVPGNTQAADNPAIADIQAVIPGVEKGSAGAQPPEIQSLSGREGLSAHAPSALDLEAKGTSGAPGLAYASQEPVNWAAIRADQPAVGALCVYTYVRVCMSFMYSCWYTCTHVCIYAFVAHIGFICGSWNDFGQARGCSAALHPAALRNPTR